MALVRAGPALAERTFRDTAMPTPRLRAASSASRRFIRGGVIASLLTDWYGCISRIVHPVRDGAVPGLLHPPRFGHARADDLSTAAGCGHRGPQGHDPCRSAGPPASRGCYR